MNGGPATFYIERARRALPLAEERVLAVPKSALGEPEYVSSQSESQNSHFPGFSGRLKFHWQVLVVNST